MWVFLSIVVICASGLLAMVLSLRHDYKVQRMVEEAKTTRKTIDAASSELYGYQKKREIL